MALSTRGALTISGFTEVKLVAHYTGMIKLLEVRLRILDAAPRA